MAECRSLGMQSPADNVEGIRSSIHQSMELTFTGSNSRSNPPSEQGNAEMRASDNEWTLADFIESSFRPTVDLSTLTAFGWLGHGSYHSNDSRLQSIPYEHESMESADALPPKKPFVTRILGLAAPRLSATDSFKRRMWNPIWLTDRILVSFLLLFVGLFFVVLALYLYSTAHSGLL